MILDRLDRSLRQWDRFYQSVSSWPPFSLTSSASLGKFPSLDGPQNPSKSLKIPLNQPFSSTTKTALVYSRRKRSPVASSATGRDSAALDEITFPILDMISSFGVRSLQEPNCQSKIVCEIGRQGGLPTANNIQRALWIIAN